MGLPESDGDIIGSESRRGVFDKYHQSQAAPGPLTPCYFTLVRPGGSRSLRAARDAEKQKETILLRGDLRVPPGETGVLLLESQSHPPPPIDGLDIHDTQSVRDWMQRSAHGAIVNGFRKLLLQFQALGSIVRLNTNAEDERTRHFEAAARALISLQEGRPIGTALPNLRAIENWIWNDHGSYYSLFLNAVDVWRLRAAFRANDPESTFMKHVAKYKARRHGDPNAGPAIQQDTSLHPIFRAAFPELDEALDRIESRANTRSKP